MKFRYETEGNKIPRLVIDYHDSDPEYILLTKHKESGEFRIMFKGECLIEMMESIKDARSKALLINNLKQDD